MQIFGLDTVGTFRVRVKIQTDPNIAKPICNLNHCWYGPFCVFVNEQHAKLLPYCEHALKDADTPINCLRGRRFPLQSRYRTLEVEKLYQRIERIKIMSEVTPILRRHIAHSRLANTFIIQLLQITLSAAAVGFLEELYASAAGIPTGIHYAPTCGPLHVLVRSLLGS